MKKIISAALVAVMAVGMMTGCGQSGKNDQLSNIKSAGKVVIAMEGQWAPWTYHDETDALVGYDVEVGQKIAEKLGVQAEFIEGEWDGLFTGLSSGKFDLVINGVEITDERKEKFDFSDPYAYDGCVLIVPAENATVASFEDLAGKTTTNSLGSTYADLAAEYGAEVMNVDTLAETIDMVLSGRADATINAESSFYDYMAEHPDAPITIAAKSANPSEIAVTMRKGEETAALRDAINKALEELKASGELSAISQKYFDRDITTK